MNKTCNNSARRQLQFLLIKTVAVRNGIKPGELLRLNACYREGRECLCLDRVLQVLDLKHLILERSGEHALVLFYHPEALSSVLNTEEARRFLAGYGYAGELELTEALAHLAARFTDGVIPHEVGVFIGYPVKDVRGFIHGGDKVPVERGSWQVFGDPAESITRMEQYRAAEAQAKGIVNFREGNTFIKDLNHNIRSLKNG